MHAPNNNPPENEPNIPPPSPEKIEEALKLLGSPHSWRIFQGTLLVAYFWWPDAFGIDEAAWKRYQAASQEPDHTPNQKSASPLPWTVLTTKTMQEAKNQLKTLFPSTEWNKVLGVWTGFVCLFICAHHSDTRTQLLKSLQEISPTIYTELTKIYSDCHSKLTKETYDFLEKTTYKLIDLFKTASPK
jgi:hypothetical protein